MTRQEERDDQARFVRQQVRELVAARKRAGLDLTDIVIRTGWSAGTVRRFEAGTSNPTLMQILVYTHAVGGDWESLVSVEGALHS